MKSLFFTIATCLLFLQGIAQNGMELNEQYPFKEGVYLTINDFLNNRAVEPAQITSVHSTKAVKNYEFSKRDQYKGLSWDFFAELVYSAKSSIMIDSVTLTLDDSGFETLVPGHNFFGLKINDRLYLNIAPHQRPGGGQEPIFGRAAFIGRLIVLYVEYEFDNDSHYYVSDNQGNMVREGGMQETVRNIIIFDLDKNTYEFADERAFIEKLRSDKTLLEKYLADKKRKKRIPYYADQFNQRNPVYLQ